MDLREYLDRLRISGIEYRELRPEERWTEMQRWLEVFAPPLYHAKPENANVGAWPVLGRPYARALAGRHAMDAYRMESAATFFVFPQDPTLPALECRGGQLPDFNALRAQVIVWPENLAWTMAFANWAVAKEPGPYFSRREWAA